MKIGGIGRVIFWGGGSVWIGQAMAAADRHSHHAIQLAIGFDGPVEFRAGKDCAWFSYAGALIAPGLPHEFRAPGRYVANLLFEPETPVGRGLLERYGNGAIARIPDALVREVSAPLQTLLASSADDAALAGEAAALLSRLAGTSTAKRRTDNRVMKVIDWIAGHLDEPLRLSEAAAVAGLSESRFRHLFVMETGIAFRPYILWSRLNRALESGFGGESWTEAAHKANFSDQAHLTRTCRRMLGLVPSSMRISALNAAEFMLS